MLSRIVKGGEWQSRAVDRTHNIYNLITSPLRQMYFEYFRENFQSSFCPDGHETETSRQMSLVTRKPVFGVFNQVRLKPACAATEAS